MKDKKTRNKKQKSFFFEDYDELETIGKNINLAKISLNRVTFLFFVFVSIIVIFSIKIIYLSTLDTKKIYSENNTKNFIKERRDIIDTNGTILARNIDIYDAGLRPQLIENKKEILINLKIIFPEINIKQV